MNRKGLWVTLAIVVIVLIALISMLAGSYNKMVGMRTEVESAFATIDVQLQRRNDLIPNLLATVKGYAQHEEDVIKAVADARANYAGAGSVEEKQQADTELSGALSRLLMVVEQYPDLKADQQFTALSDELAGTENRIAVARKDYNDRARDYNKTIRMFPKNILASLFGFEEESYFEAEAGAKDVPKVDFSK